VRDRAVMLAQLLPGRTLAVRAGRAADGGSGAAGRGVAVGGQRLGQRLDPGTEVSAGHCRSVPAFQVGQLPAGEVGDGLRTRRLGQEPERVGGQVVVGVLERAAARVSDDEDLGRPAAPTVSVGPGGPGLDQALADEVVQVPPDSRRREPEPAAESGGGRRPELQDQPGDLPPGGAALTDCMFFTTSLCRK